MNWGETFAAGGEIILLKATFIACKQPGRPAREIPRIYCALSVEARSVRNTSRRHANPGDHISDNILASERTAPVLGSAIKAGLIAGAVFIAVEMVLVWLAMSMNPFAPLHMIAAIAMGPELLPGPGIVPGSNAGVIVVALLLHVVLSVALAFAFKLIAGALRLNGAMLLASGVLFGLLIYGIHFYGMTALFPWFAMARNWVSVLAHAVFGLVLAYALMPRMSVTIVEERV